MTSIDSLAAHLGLRRGSDLPVPTSDEPARLPWSAADQAEAVDFVVVDVETACGRASSICQVGLLGFRDGREVLTYETLVDPQDEFSPFNIGLHGIGPQHVEGKPTFARLHAGLARQFERRITVAHSGFDKGAFAAACRVAGLPAFETRWLDSVQVARHAWPDLETHRLNRLAAYLGLEHKHHDALSDARVAGLVVVRAMEHTGIDLEGWMARPWLNTRRRTRSSPRRQGVQAEP